MGLNIMNRNTIISVIDKMTNKSKSKKIYSDLDLYETAKVIRKRLVRKGLVGKNKRHRKYYLKIKKDGRTKTFSIKGKGTLEETFKAVLGERNV